MTITVFSVIMSFVCSSIILFAASFLIAHARRVRWGLILLIFLLGFVRLVMPVEIWPAKEIISWGIYPMLQDLAKREWVFGIDLAELLLLIWGAGLLVLFVRFLINVRATKEIVEQAVPVMPGDRLYEIFSRVVRDLNYQGKVRVAVTGYFSTPVSVGFFSPIILIPKAMLDIPEMELYGVVCHELTHYLRGDVGKQRFLDVMKCLFWWNLVIHYLNQSVVEMLELECDARTTRDMDDDGKDAYINAMQRVLRAKCKKEPKIGLCFGRKHRVKFMERRYLEVLDPVPKLSNRTTYCLGAICLILFCVSYSFILQPARGTTEKYAGPFEIRDNRLDTNRESVDFLLRLSDGTYLHVSDMIGEEVITEEKRNNPPYADLPVYEKMQ